MVVRWSLAGRAPPRHDRAPNQAASGHDGEHHDARGRAGSSRGGAGQGGTMTGPPDPPPATGLEHGHSVEEIRDRISNGPRVNYLRDWVYGGIDGAVTTFAVVAGVVGADLSSRVLLILGAANVLADGFSMAASNYSGTKAEIDDYRRLRAMEERHIDEAPEGEREEIRQIFRAKGFAGQDLARAVAVITASRQRWIDTMLAEEHGMPAVQRSPVIAGLCTFVAFMLCGLVPLLPFLVGLQASVTVAAIMTAAVFFGIGSLKSLWSPAHWLWSGLETLTIGMGAAALAWLVGHFLKTLV
jgi:VIT1/CCC1 family predicted Fe2+/Mn2+ transporter